MNTAFATKINIFIAKSGIFFLPYDLILPDFQENLRNNLRLPASAFAPPDPLWQIFLLINRNFSQLFF